jgi:hypothetical protein
MIPGVSRWLGMAVAMAMAMDALVCMLACSDGGLKRNMFASNEFVCVRCINVDHVFGSQQEKQVERVANFGLSLGAYYTPAAA